VGWSLKRSVFDNGQTRRGKEETYCKWVECSKNNNSGGYQAEKDTDGVVVDEGEIGSLGTRKLEGKEGSLRRFQLQPHTQPGKFLARLQKF